MEDYTSTLYQKFKECPGVCTDTRLLNQNEIFFALKGPNFDGNMYALDALKRGAAYAIVDDPEFCIPNDSRFILVPDVLNSLQKLAKYHRQQFDFPFLAITGSNGKTTTKELTVRALSDSFNVHYTQGNLNNHIGVPLTILRIKEGADFAIIEMGANHVGDIALLCDIAAPTHGLITNIGTAHIGEFGGKENLVRGKSELFDYLRWNGGVPFINKLDGYLNNMAKRFDNDVSYPNDNCKLVDAVPYVNYCDNQNQEHSTSIIGEYNYMNISAAITVAQYFGEEDPYTGIDKYLPDNNRSEILELATNTIVLDAYNANPDSMSVALKNLVAMPGESKIAMLGEMEELGAYAEEEHKKIVIEAEIFGVDKLYLVGDGFASAGGKHIVMSHVDDLIDLLRNEPMSGKTVLVKGSRSVQMEKLTKAKSLWI